MLEHRKKSNLYTNSTGSNTFNPSEMRAYSYRWWLYLTRHETYGIIFNTYSYSSSTSKHQSDLRNLLYRLNIKIDHYLEAPEGLDRLGVARTMYENRVKDIEAILVNPRRKKALDDRRRGELQYNKDQIHFIDKLEGRELNSVDFVRGE